MAASRSATASVEPAGAVIHSAPIDQQDVAEVRAGLQLECAAVVALGGCKGLGRLELPLGRARRRFFDRTERPVPLLARDQGAEEIEPEQLGGGLDAGVETDLGLAEPAGVEVGDGQNEVGAELVGVEPDGGLGRVDRVAELAAGDLFAADQKMIERGRGPERPGELFFAGPARFVARLEQDGGTAEVVGGGGLGTQPRPRSPGSSVPLPGSTASDRIKSKSKQPPLTSSFSAWSSASGSGSDEAPGGSRRPELLTIDRQRRQRGVAEYLPVIRRLDHPQTHRIELGLFPQIAEFLESRRSSRSRVLFASLVRSSSIRLSTRCNSAATRNRNSPNSVLAGTVARKLDRLVFSRVSPSRSLALLAWSISRFAVCSCCKDQRNEFLWYANTPATTPRKAVILEGKRGGGPRPSPGPFACTFPGRSGRARIGSRRR